jgi:hypothetical protein
VTSRLATGNSRTFFYGVGTLGVHMKGILPWLVLWACCASTRDFCPALDAPVSPVQNICFPPRTLFHFLFFPSAQQAGQTVVPDRLSLNMCLWSYLRQVGRKEVDMNDVRLTSGEYAGREHNMFPEKDSS